MASNMVAEATPLNWKRTLKNEDAEDVLSRKLTQAEALSMVITCEDFHTFNEAIQHNVLWLLSELLTETREAYDETQEIAAPKIETD